jgi:hypothetical protein
MTMQTPKREDVSFRAEPGHQAHGKVGEQRSLTAPFSREKIREMDFDEGHPDREQRVTDRQARVSVGPAVQDESLGAAGELLNGVHQRALVVGLGEGNPDFEASRFLSNHSFDIGQRPVPIDVRFALAKQIEIRTVENGDPKGQRFKPLSHSLN